MSHKARSESPRELAKELHRKARRRAWRGVMVAIDDAERLALALDVAEADTAVFNAVQAFDEFTSKPWKNGDWHRALEDAVIRSRRRFNEAARAYRAAGST